MFIKYQKVRNSVLGFFAVIGAGIAAIFGFQSNEGSRRPIDTPAVTTGSNWSETRSTSRNDGFRTSKRPPKETTEQPRVTQSLTQQTNSATTSATDSSSNPPTTSPKKAFSPNKQYVLAMTIANADSRGSDVAKDILGSNNPWKLNLYDDNRDGRWERAKLDKNRDGIDDEKWNFKNGTWEKAGGKTVWSNNQWVSRKSLTAKQIAGSKLDRYREAFRIASAYVDSSGKGKDVLGSGHPWKLNLYDDDRNGQWDRAKLDTNRDGNDDEKWNFKKGRWEKDGGRTIWSNNNWIAQSASPAAAPVSKQARYQAAMSIAQGRATASGKGKDVLGGSSPWKLNLYDDNRDGKWDRGKLDTNRDDVDDEKWNFKKGRWEKDGGRMVWQNNRWQSNKSVESALKTSSDPNQARYRSAMAIATGRADRSGKGKDVLGGASPWKLNLYDDNRDGKWDRGKLDRNRDNVDDEKWNFKNGRWEKDGGQKIWNGTNWVETK